MTLEATVTAVGFSSFLLLYAAFNISNERMLEKAVLYFLGLVQVLVMTFVLLSESLEVSSPNGYLSAFLEKYFVFMVIGFIAIVALFMLTFIEKAIKGFGGKDGKE